MARATYRPAGKTTFFVYNQSKIDTVPVEQIARFEEEYKETDEENKVLVADLRIATSGAWPVSPMSGSP